MISFPVGRGLVPRRIDFWCNRAEGDTAKRRDRDSGVVGKPASDRETHPLPSTHEAGFGWRVLPMDLWSDLWLLTNRSPYLMNCVGEK